MLHIQVEPFKEYIKNILTDEIETIGGEYELTIDTVEELSDYTIDCEDCDLIYHEMYALLPQVFDDALDVLYDLQDDGWDGWAEYYRNIR